MNRPSAMCWLVSLRKSGLTPTTRPSISWLEMAHVLAELAQRRGAGDRGNGLDDPIEVLVGQAVLEDEAVVVLLLRRVHVVDRLGAADDDVGGARARRSAAGPRRWPPRRWPAWRSPTTTPKISPRIVSSTRSLCSVRLRRARAMVFQSRCMARLAFTSLGCRCSRLLGPSLGALLALVGLELGGGAEAGVEGHAARPP